MLNIFTLANGRLVQEEIESLEELSRFQPIWVDLESPTVEEKRWIAQYYGVSIPADAMDEDIEESARFYEEDNGELHIRSDFLIADEDEPRTVRVAGSMTMLESVLPTSLSEVRNSRLAGLSAGNSNRPTAVRAVAPRFTTTPLSRVSW